jgi:alcohol dehydrogenase
VREKMGVAETILSKGAPADDVKTFTDLTGGKLGNVVVDATGSAKSMVGAMQYVGFAGRLVWVGITQDELHFTQPLMHRREMTFLASRNALSHEFTRIIRLIEGGMLDTQPWITHRAPMDALIGEFPNWLKPETGVVKAMVEVS